MIERRQFLHGIGLATVGQVAPVPAFGFRLVLTPGQTEGPFYPITFPEDADNDLVRVVGQAAQALGRVLHLEGRVMGRDGRGISGAVVEIWQCDANGRYRHPRAPGSVLSDSAFQGYGRASVDAGGWYRFRTIRPVPYPGRTPHIHVAVEAPGASRFVTQMYVEGEPLNERDFLLNGIRDPDARRSVIVPLADATGIESGALRGAFDIVLDV